MRSSIRWRLTLAYGLALMATIIAFGTTLYITRQRTSSTAFDQRLQQRLILEAELSAKYLNESYRVLGRLVAHSPEPALEPLIAPYFESFRDYLILADTGGRVLFISDSASALPIASIERLRSLVHHPPAVPDSGTFVFDSLIGPVRYLAYPIKAAGPEIAAVLVAAPSSTNLVEANELLSSMLVIAPLIMGAALLVGYWVAGRSLQPLGAMINELEAITDSRSLYRRLAVDRTEDEVARLGSAVNHMFDRLERSFAALHRFTAEASHELKTPLMVLRAGVERALRNPATPPESLQALDESLMHIGRMAELVDSLLMLARADEGQIPLALEDCDLRDLVGEAAETANILAEEAELTVTTWIPEVPVMLGVDRSRIRQLLLNLVTNAVKYTPSGGTVSLRLTDEGDSVIITVGDTGIGIAAGDLEHIFDRFWRADPARSREGESPGTGLGLAITKWVAEAHGGSIAVQSRPGRGTVFTVGLPRIVSAQSAVS